jgi:uncharacterized membrane protein YagU involved in acid resistance
MTLLRLVLGLICGIVATGPMSAVMVLLHRRLPAIERYPLPPREITTKALAQLTPPHRVPREVRAALTWLAHFGYGGAAGALYAGTRRWIPGRAITRGPLLGLVVWAVSYLILLPALHILTPAVDHPVRRNALMIGAHLVWGWALAAIHDVLFHDVEKPSAAFDASPHPHYDSHLRS